MSKHTNGPWVTMGRYVIDAHGKVLAAALADDGAFSLDEAKTNARLIAAAPDMYEELRQSMNVMNEVCTMLRDRGDSAHAAELAERIRACRVLLAKAEGK